MYVMQLGKICFTENTKLIVYKKRELESLSIINDLMVFFLEIPGCQNILVSLKSYST